MGDYDGARAIADELITESADAGRLREETAGHNLYAEIHMERGEWNEAIAALELVVEIAHDIGDNGLATSAHARLGRCWIELGDIKKAGFYTRQVILRRPHDPDIDRLHARASAAIGNWLEAAAALRGARAKAGESWTVEDEELIQYYQAKAEQAAATE
jgi:tetratricopeptide (TPR) repeat protein